MFSRSGCSYLCVTGLAAVAVAVVVGGVGDVLATLWASSVIFNFADDDKEGLGTVIGAEAGETFGGFENWTTVQQRFFRIRNIPSPRHHFVPHPGRFGAKLLFLCKHAPRSQSPHFVHSSHYEHRTSWQESTHRD